MKPIKELLKLLFWMGYASSWWASFIWGHDDMKLLWLIPIFSSIILFVSLLIFLIDNWNKEF